MGNDLPQRRPAPPLLLSIYCLLLCLAPAGRAQEKGDVEPPPAPCLRDGSPAATLLVPYFEVDLGDADGLTTLVSINNAGEEATPVRVVVWSDCAVPVLAFDLYLEPRRVRTLNLRDLLFGILPASGPGPAGPAPPGCSDPVALPPFGPEEASRLRARLTGQPDPSDGLCYASGSAGPSRATGYLTVDTMAACPSLDLLPGDPGYFGEGGTASSANVLWGDIFYVDPAGDAAQGIAAVAVPADAERHQAGTIPSFYPGGSEDDRLPLASRYRARFLKGGAFDGGTELLIWLGAPRSQPGACAEASCPNALPYTLRVETRGEDASAQRSFELPVRRYILRLPVEEELLILGIPGGLPVPVPFGSLDLSVVEDGAEPDSFRRRQGWLLPVYTALGRFSVGLEATRRNDLCTDQIDFP